MADTNKKMLNFKMGLLERLQELTTKTPGTIYVTTDERAMYVDVDDSTRIRLGNAVIPVESLDALKAKEMQPWQKGALYFVADKEILLLWNGSEWKLVNDSLMKQVTTLANDLQTVTTNLGTTNTNLGNLTDLVGTLPSLGEDIDTVGKALEHLDGRLTTVEEQVATLAGTGTGSLAGLAKRVTTAEGKISTAEGKISTLENTVSGHGTQLGDHETRIDDLEAQDVLLIAKDAELAGLIGDNKDAIDAIKADYLKAADKTALQNSIDGVNTELGTLKTNVSGMDTRLTAAVGKAQEDAEKGIADAAAAKRVADQAVLDAEAAQSTADGAASKAAENAGAIATLQTDLGKTNSNLSTLSTKVDGHTTKLGEHTTDIANLKAKDTELANKDAELEGKIGTNTTAIEGLKSRMSTAEGTIATYGTNISDLQDEDKQIRTDFAAADTQIRADFAAADNAVRKAFADADAALKSAYEAKDTELAGLIAGNTSEISKVDTRVTTVAGEIRGEVAGIQKALEDEDTRLAGLIKDNADAIDVIEAALGLEGTEGNSISKQIEAINGEISGVKANVATNAGNIATNAGDIRDIKGQITSINETLDTKATTEALNGVQSELDTAIKAVDAKAIANANAISGINTTIAKLATKDELASEKATLKGLIEGVDAKADANGTAITGLDGRLDTAESDIDSLEGKMSAAENTIASHTTDIGKNAKAISDLEKKHDNELAAIKNDTAAVEGELVLDSFADVKSFIKTSIAASNAMVFKGTISSDADLTALKADSTVEQGHTYKVDTSGFYNGLAEKCRVGDLFIALKDQPTTAADWAYIPSGGEDFNEAVLQSEENSTVIKITDDLNHIHGSVEFVSGNESLEVTGADANKIAISMVWGSF